MSPRARVTAAAVTLAGLLVVTGTWHFAAPRGFESIVPSFLGSPAFWVRLSGVGELSCAAGLLIPRTRRVAGWATAALFVIVFPANIDMAVQAWQGPGSRVLAYGRLPLQIPLVLWALFIARGHGSDGRKLRQVGTARSASLRRMQNSLPSGSANTTHPDPSGRRRS